MNSLLLPLLVYAAIALAFAFTTASLAAEQGRSRRLWGVSGFLLGPIATLLLRLSARNRSETDDRRGTQPVAPAPTETGSESQAQSSELAPGANERLIRLAQAGNFDAQVALGEFYLDYSHPEVATSSQASVAPRRQRLVLSPEPEEAFIQLAREGNRAARMALGRAYLNQYHPNSSFPGMVQTQLPELPPRPDDRLIELAQAGNLGAGAALGEFYFDQDHPATYELSFEWNQWAAMRGDAGSQGRLATIYHEGLGVERDPQRAFEFWLAAAEQGHAGAQAMVGASYESGISVPKDRVEAAYWMYLSYLANNAAGDALYRSLWRKLSDREKDTFRELLRARHPEAGEEGDEE